jgi:MFS family permease
MNGKLLTFRLLPPGVAPEAMPLLWAKGLRAVADGFVAVLLPVYLLKLGFGPVAVGLVGTATLLGSALTTMAVGVLGHRFSRRRLLLAAAGIMAGTGVGFISTATLWPLLVVAFAGTLNPTASDVSLFLPLEHSVLAHAAPDRCRTDLFARYSLVGSLGAAVGSLCAGLPEVLEKAGIDPLTALRGMFVVYALTGLACIPLYRRVPDRPNGEQIRTPLGPSRGIVYRMAGLFSLDSFAGGMIVRSLLALWLFQRFGLAASAAGMFFFWTDLLTGASYLAAVPVSRRFGLINTMVFTHIPSSICLILAALSPSLSLALLYLLLRSALSEMDVPTRSSYVMAVVGPAERPAAAAFTAVPRSLAAAASPALAGGLIAAGSLALPLLLCGGLKIAYDVMLLVSFRHTRPPEECAP